MALEQAAPSNLPAAASKTAVSLLNVAWSWPVSVSRVAPVTSCAVRLAWSVVSGSHAAASTHVGAVTLEISLGRHHRHAIAAPVLTACFLRIEQLTGAISFSHTISALLQLQCHKNWLLEVDRKDYLGGE